MIFKKKFKTHARRIKINQAFSLIELSIVLVIISILITGALSASISSVNNAKYGTTRKLMDALYTAIGNYVKINKKLPCPASLKLAKSSTDYGQATGTDGDCSEATGGVNDIGTTDLVYGMVPVNDLGLLGENGEDAFGTKFSYVVNKNLTKDDTFDDLFIDGTPDPNGSITVNDNGRLIQFDLLIISHGANKAGGFDANSTSASARSSDLSEQSNDYLDSSATFLANDSSSDEFDDILLSKKLTALISEFNAFEHIKCKAQTEVALYGSTNVSWDEALYGQEAVAITACPACSSAVDYRGDVSNPTRKCNAFGQWGAIIKPCVPAGPC